MGVSSTFLRIADVAIYWTVGIAIYFGMLYIVIGLGCSSTNPVILNKFIDEQVNLVNIHNKYELDNGFVSRNRGNQLCSAKHMSYDAKLEWYRMNDISKKEFENNQFFDCCYKSLTVCKNHPLLDKFTCDYVSSLYPFCTECKENYKYDSLIVAPLFCDISPRSYPNVEVVSISNLKFDNVTGKSTMLVRINLSLPNGTYISANDDRVKLYSHGRNAISNNCNFSIISNTHLLLQYDETSGFTKCLPKHYSENKVLSDSNPLDCSNPVCSFSFGWNWSNPIVNSPNVSKWLVRQEYHQSFLRLNPVDVALKN